MDNCIVEILRTDRTRDSLYACIYSMPDRSALLRMDSCSNQELSLSTFEKVTRLTLAEGRYQEPVFVFQMDESNISQEPDATTPYPSEADLAYIAKFDILKHNIDVLISFIQDIWYIPDYATTEAGTDSLGEPVTYLVLITGGWSGNESIVAALMENRLFWSLCWEESRRGGYHRFRAYPLPIAQKSGGNT